MAGADGRAVVLAALLLLSLSAPAAGTSDTQQAAFAPTQVETDDVLLAVDLQADGDATWRVAYRTRLDDQNTTEAFEDLQADVRANPENYTATFRERMVRTAASAENATGRDMAIQNVTVSAEKKQLPQEYGVITYRFTWTNFAAVDGPRLRVGDALRGLFLDSETTLLFTWPAEYRVQSVAPRNPADVGDNQVAWTGPLEFSGDEPALVLTTEPATATTTPPADGGGFPLLPVIAVVIVLALGAFGFLYSTGRIGSPSGAAGGDDGGDGGGGGADETTPPPELLSNEEQVLNLLEDHGGRMKQQQIVEELDWTEAKTSQVVSDLREDDEVETFRIGRENVVTLPDEEV